MVNAGKVRLITRGDDLGSNRTANQAISEAFRHGMLCNTSLMVVCAAAEDAARALSREAGLCVGLHCTVNAEWDGVRWGPVLPPERVPSLVDGDGSFLRTTRALHDRQPSLDEVMSELRAQLQRARDLGFDIRYADQHMGFSWVVEGLDRAFDEWCALEGLRNAARFRRSLPDAGAVGDPVERLVADLGAARDGQYVLVTHPAYDNDEMRALGHPGSPGDWVAESRDWDRRKLVDPRVLSLVAEGRVVPTRYDEADEAVVDG